jgi:hypothetical protein
LRYALRGALRGAMCHGALGTLKFTHVDMYYGCVHNSVSIPRHTSLCGMKDVVVSESAPLLLLAAEPLVMFVHRAALVLFSEQCCGSEKLL